MDFTLTLLLILILILVNFLVYKNKRKFNKIKNTVYLFLVLVILILGVIIVKQKNKKNKKQNFTNQYGGSKNKALKLLKKCNLPNNSSTRHCFRDNTHQTCCMLSPEVRKHADETGNPIGKISLKAYKEFLKENNLEIPSDEVLKKMSTPWCTCLGAQVCKNYKFRNNKVDEKMSIKFINDKQTDNIVVNPSPQCELHYSDKYLTINHRTPGVEESGNNYSSERCNREKKIQQIR